MTKNSHYPGSVAYHFNLTQSLSFHSFNRACPRQAAKGDLDSGELSAGQGSRTFLCLGS